MVDNTNGLNNTLNTEDEKTIDYLDKLIIKDETTADSKEYNVPFDEKTNKTATSMKTDEELRQFEMSTELSNIMKKRRSQVSTSITPQKKEELKQTKLSPELEMLMKRRQSSSSEPSSIKEIPKNQISSELEAKMTKQRTVTEGKKSSIKEIPKNQISSELEAKMTKQRSVTEGKKKIEELKQFNMSSELDAIMKKKRYGQATELEKRELQAAIEIRKLQSAKSLDKSVITAHNKVNKELSKQKLSPELEAVMERQRLQKSTPISKPISQNEMSPNELETILKRRQSEKKVTEVRSLNKDQSLKKFEMSSELEQIMERRKRVEEM